MKQKGFSLSHSLESGSGAEEASILELNFGELLIAVHLDDEWHSQDQKGGAGDPRRLANATEVLLGHDGGFGGSMLGMDDNGRLGHVVVMFILFGLVMFMFFFFFLFFAYRFDVHVL